MCCHVRLGLERGRMRDTCVTRADERLGDVSPYNVYLSCSPKKVECPK